MTSTEWDLPAGGDPRAVLILAHGAGGTLNTPQLRAIAAALTEHGIASLRFNFAYTDAGKKAPDRMPKLVDAFREVAEAAVARFPGTPVFLGGRSMGGRAASHLAVEGFDAAGLVFIAYPLHPPGKPERMRDEHLPDVKAPMLFLQGTRDPFSTPSLLHGVLQRLPNATLIEIDGGDHSFKVPGRKQAEVDAELANHIAAFLT